MPCRKKEREPEEQVQVGPQHAGVDHPGGLEEVVMVVPPRAQQREAEEVAEEGGDEWLEILEPGAFGRPQLKDHDRDDDCDDAVAECLEPALGHTRMLVACRQRKSPKGPDH